MKKNPGMEKVEWAFDHESAWKAVRVQVMGGRDFGEVLTAEFLQSCRREAVRWEAELDAVRVFSTRGAGIALSFYEPTTGSRSGAAKVVSIPRGGKGWPDGELGLVLEEFHRLAPLSEMWSWRTSSGAQSLFPLARPTAWPLLLSLSLFSPLAKVLPTLGKAPNVLVTGFGFVDGRMELCFQAPKPLPELAASAPAGMEAVVKDSSGPKLA